MPLSVTLAADEAKSLLSGFCDPEKLSFPANRTGARAVSHSENPPMNVKIPLRLVLLGSLFGLAALSSSCGPLGGSEAGGNHKVVNAAGLQDLGVRIREAGNAYRRSNGKSPLANHAGLQEMAQKHSEAMARSGKLDHAGSESRNGIAQSKYQIGATGENVMRQHGRDAQAMLQTWINSAPHRRTLLESSYAVTGLGIAQDEQGNVWVTQIFGWKPGSGQGTAGVGHAW